MENKINIAELLKNCPTGMELDCTICNGVKFIELNRNPYFPITLRANNGYEFYLSKYGQVHNIDDAKCVIFPKGKTTWDGFERPFKEGDIVFEDRFHSICIFKKEGCIKGTIDYYCGISFGGFYVKDEKNIDKHFGDISNYRLATEEEKEKLFKVIKDNGYRWNAETKTLEKLIVPKFKVGDRIKNKASKWIYKVADIKENEYIVNLDYKTLNKNSGYHLAFCNEDDYELVPNKFDITTLKPFDKVLVRDTDTHRWTNSLYSYYTKLGTYKYSCINGDIYVQCIPFEENKHLLGTTNECDEFYKNW